MDSLLLEIITNEIKNTLVGATIIRIKTLSDEGFLISCRLNNNEYNVVIFKNKELSRIHLTEKKWSALKKNSHFGLLLQNHLSGAKIHHIYKVPNERIVNFILLSKFPENEEIVLSVIFFGVFTNIVLWKPKTAEIIAAIQPLQSNLPVIDNDNSVELFSEIFTDKESFQFEYNKSSETSLSKFIMKTFQLYGKIIPEEVERAYNLLKAFEDEETAVWKVVSKIQKILVNHNWQPYIRFTFENENKRKAISLLPFLLADDTNAVKFSSFSTACDNFYWEKQRFIVFKKQKTQLLQKYHLQFKRLLKTIKKMQREEDEILLIDKFQKYGDLIFINIKKIKPKISSIYVEDLFSDSQNKLKIPLDPSLTSVQNAQKYLILAAKLRRRKKILHKRMKDARKNKDKIEKALKLIEETKDWKVINNHEKILSEESPTISLKIEKKKNLQKKIAGKKTFHRFKSSDGFIILVGRNQKENDMLTLQEAKPVDFWFHVRQGTGSHVVVKNPNRLTSLPAATYIEAAMLAGHYSKFKKEAFIEVMVTQKRFVRKPKGSSPGLVTVEREKNIRVEMKPETIKDLLNQKVKN